MAYLLDSGFLYAQINSKESLHGEVSKVETERFAGIIMPVPAVTEVAYLLRRDLGAKAVAEFVHELSETDIILESPLEADYLRSAEILRKYDDVNIDFVDACIVAMAERLNITKILTVDHRHFRMFRPAHCPSFELIPGEL